MAWSGVPLGSVASTTAASSYSTGSYTPTANRLLVAFVQNSGPGADDTVDDHPTFSGNGVPWSEVAQAIPTSSPRVLTMFVALSGASPTTGAATAAYGQNQAGACISVEEVEIEGGVPATALGAIAQSVAEAPATGGTSPTKDLASAPAATSRCIAAWSTNRNEAMGVRTNWTEFHDIGFTTPDTHLETQWRSDAAEQTAGSSWATSSLYRVIVAEIAETPAAGGVSGDIDSTFPAFTADATGEVLVSGDIESTFPAFQTDATGTAEGGGRIGSIDSTFPAFTTDATGEVPVSGDIESTFPAFTTDASGEVLVQGDIDSAFPAFTTDATGTVEGAGISGTIESTFPAFETSASGIAEPALLGPRAWPRRSQLIPNLHFELDGHRIEVAENSLAVTIANGGYATLRATASETDMRRFPSSFEQGAPMRVKLDNGRITWEGEIDANPIADNGMVELDASGARSVAEERDDPYLLQSRDTGLFSDEAGAPFNGSPSAHIAASVAEGALHYSVSEGAVVAQNDAHALIGWIQGSTARRFRGSMYVSGTGTGYSIRVYRMTGPTGARTQVGSDVAVTNGALIDVQPTTPEDSLVIELRRTGTSVTQADDLTVDIRDVRINDFTLADDFSASSVMSDVGRRLGWDVDGIPSGPGVDTANPAIQIDTYVVGTRYKWIPRDRPPGPGWPFPMGTMEEIGTYSELIDSDLIPAVLTSPLNVLPLAWGGRWGGNWAELLDYVASLVDWRWIAGGNVFGKGPVLHFGPYGPAWNVSLSKNAVPQLRSQPIFNVVVVRYTTADGGTAEVRVRADPDPLRHRGRGDRPHLIPLQGVQKDATLATIIAHAAIEEVSKPRPTGTIDIVGADNGLDDMTIFDVVGGHLAELAGYGPLRIQQTEAGPSGVRLGIGQPSSVAAILALEAKRQMQKPFGTVVRSKQVKGPRHVT